VARRGRTPAQSRSTPSARTTPPPSSPGQRIVTAPRVADDTVRRAQEALERAGYEIGSADGQMGPRTLAAIKRFQTDRYLTVSGQLDDSTLAALGVSSGATPSAAHLPAIADPVNALVSFSDDTGRLGIFAATNAGLYRTFDSAQGWDRVNYGSGIDVRTTCISTSTQNPKVIFVGTATSGVLISRDAG